MPLVNGTLTDFGLDPLLINDPALIFRASSTGLAGMNLLSARKAVEVIPASNGFFEVDLVSTDAIAPAETHYLVEIQYRDTHTRQRITELLPWKLLVPPAGGALADLLRVPSNPALVWTGPAAPENATPGTWWLDSETGDLSEHDGQGWAYKANLRGPAGYNATDAAGDDAALAAFIASTVGTTATRAALDARYLPRDYTALDAASQLDANGDSFLANDVDATPGRRYIAQLATKYGPILYNRAAGGSWMIDAAMRAIGTENTMPRRFDNHVVVISAGINEAIQSTNTAGVHAGYRRALESLLWLAAAESRIEESAWTYTGAWSDQSVALASPNAQYFSGGAAKATTDDAGAASIVLTGTDYVNINYTFPSSISTANRGTWFVNDVQVAANYADAGTSTTQGRFFHPAPTPLLNLGAGNKTIRVAAPAIGFTYIDTLLKLSTAPPLIVIVKPAYTKPGGTYPIANAVVDAYRADIDATVASVRAAYAPLSNRIIVVDPVAEGFNAVTMTGADGLHLNNTGHDFYAALIERITGLQTSARRQILDGLIASLLTDPSTAAYKILNP